MGSPPPEGSKNVVLMFRSVSSMVIAPANTGKESNSSMAVIKTDHTNKGVRSMSIPLGRMLITVEMKFTAPKIDEMPAKCNEKIDMSTLGPEWAMFLESGGYTVQPVPTPISTSDLIKSNVKEGGKSQNLMLFNRGNAMSGAPIMMGKSQFPKPPIMMGITMKKIMMNACDVTMTLYIWSLLMNDPGCANSIRMIIL
uniref:Cytochrome c oxidase subunit I n=2 Tax=Nephotettix virescens TaxID=1032906 RepID=A0A077JD78_NEPVI|nr:cytochrome c oxidase subunit I [Nephotettix virescens]